MISIIVAVDANDNGIGKDNKLLWKLPTDMEHFKNVTKGATVVMGRKTYESIPKKFRPLPNRENIVVTRNTEYAEEGITVCNTVNETLELIQNRDNVFIIGGEQIYEEFHKYATKLYLTEVFTPGLEEYDAFFPELLTSYEWEEVSREVYPKLEGHDYPFDIAVYQKLEKDI